MSLSPYFLNVALHATALSAILAAILLLVKNPHRRAALSLSGLLAVLLLPWISALRSQPEKPTPVWISPVMVKLPQWTIAHLPSPVTRASATPAPQIAEPLAEEAPAAVSALQPEFTKSRQGLRTMAACVWCVGTTTCIVVLVTICFGLVRWERGLRSTDDAEWELLERLPLPTGITRRHFRVTTAEVSPCVAGLLRPVVVLPCFLLQGDRQRELRWAVGHEACHWRGGDSRWIAVLGFIRALHWWNPLVHSLIAAWSEAREQICDLAAANDERADYGQFLIAMAARPLTATPLAIPMVVRRRRLRRLRGRVIALLNASYAKHGAGRRFHLTALASLLTGGLLISGITIAQDKQSVADAPAGKESKEATFPYDFGGHSAEIEGFDFSAGHPPLPLRWHDAEGPAPLDKDEPPPLVNSLAVSALDPASLKEAILPAKADGEDENLQTKIQANIVYSNHPLVAEDTRVIHAKDYATFRHSVLEDRSNVVAPFPMVTARNGEQATIEIIREFIFPIGDGKFETRNLGWILHARPFFKENEVVLNLKADYGFIAGHAFGTGDLSAVFAKGSPADLRMATGESRDSFGPEDILVTSLGEVEKGCYATVLTRAVTITADGRPAAPGLFFPADAGSMPHQRLRLKATIATLPLTARQKQYRTELEKSRKGIPTDLTPFEGIFGRGCEDQDLGVPYLVATQPNIATTLSRSFVEHVIEKARKSTEPLDPVEISTDELVQPWKGLDLKLSTAMARSFFAPVMMLTLDTDQESNYQLLPGYSSWAIELKPTSRETRRLLLITPEWVR